MSSRAVEKYLRTRTVQGPWRIAGSDPRDLDGAVVIPALAEGESLFATLASLARNPAEMLERFLVLVVVNHREDASPEEKERNRRDLERLAAGEGVSPGLQLAWIDAASPGLELPTSRGGVGLARKIGFDLALERLGHSGDGSPLLVSLDADTLVRPDYLEALTRHFRRAKEGGAVLPFCHQGGETTEQDSAIQRYELFLRHHVLGLSLAGSPYAFHTVGSAMACRCDAYVRAGGMNRRAAGEDFYFLQQLAKTCGVAPLRGTVVYPSARPSGRTPFGTGRSVARLLGGEADAVLFYRPGCYRILGIWLDLVSRNWEAPGDGILQRAAAVSAPLAEFLERAGFAGAWSGLQRNHRGREAFLDGFHGWFDALKTVRFIHHLCAGPLPRVGPDRALPGLLKWAGLEPACEIGKQIALLRAHQVGEDLRSASLEAHLEARSR